MFFFKVWIFQRKLSICKRKFFKSLRNKLPVHHQVKERKSKERTYNMVSHDSIIKNPLFMNSFSIIVINVLCSVLNVSYLSRIGEWKRLLKHYFYFYRSAIAYYIFTPKIEALHRAIRWINKQDSTSIPCLGLDLSPLDSNNWLAGFTDADGSFSITVYDRKKNGVFLRTSVQTFFRIELKQNYSRKVTQDQGGDSYFNILSEIAAFFTVNLYTRIRKREDKVYYAFMVVSHNSKSHEIVRKYFDRFPLYSSKNLAYKDWCLVQDLHKVNLSKEKLDKIKIIKNNFNSKRKVFNFSHLDSLHFK